MARKFSQTAPRTTSKRSAPPAKIRLPSSQRVVTSRALRTRASDAQGRSTRRDVPEIRLSGAWLERVGFPKGCRYLISADASFATIYLQADMMHVKRRC